MTLYVIGGHLTPALAVIDLLLKSHKDVVVHFVGREYSQTLSKQISQERKEIEKRNVPFFPIEAAKFHRSNILLNIPEILKIPGSLVSLYRLFRSRSRPDVVLSFGGYLAFPVCFVAKMFGARIITHEQTRVAGLANQALSTIADVVAVAHKESLAYFPKEKTVVTGNPIRESLFREYKVAPPWLAVTSQLPLLYITGGSQGSHIINQTIASLLPRLVRSFIVVHQCGVSKDHQYSIDLDVAREKLPTEHQSRYIVREWIDERDVSFLLHKAKFVISRSGANTVLELTLAGTPAIFIPLAFAYNDEQYKNAVSLLDADASLVLLQKDLFPDSLYEKVLEMNRRYDTIKKHMEKQKENLITDGAKRLVDIVLKTE